LAASRSPPAPRPWRARRTGFAARAGACAEQAAAGCAPLPDGEASPDYLRHLVAVHARQALGEAFTAS
jgi:CO/xanthine dehydrogenase FAD-binding subunit